MSVINRYIDIDSTYRDRNTYPEVGDFVLETNKTSGTSAFTAVDPVALSFPYDTGLTAVNGSVTTIFGYTFLTTQLGAGARNTANFYVGSYIQFPYFNVARYFLIVAYNNTTKVIYAVNWNLTSVEPAFVAPNVNTDYMIFFQLPVNLNPSAALGAYNDTTGISTSASQIKLGALASSVTDVYKGMYLFLPPTLTSIFPYILTDPQYAYQWALITAYNGTTKVATIRKQFLVTPPAGTRYSICPFSYDNCRSLQYFGTETFNNARCVSISLTNLTIPAFLPLTNIRGGYITDYPYVYVAVYSEKGITYQQPIISASPATKETLFKCALTNTQPTKYYNLGSVISSQNVSFRMNDSLRFKILLPNGEPVTFSPSLYTLLTGSFTFFSSLPFPVSPDPETQVQGTFNVTFSQ